MTIATSDQKQFSTSLQDYAKTTGEALRAWYQNANLGMTQPNDEEFRLWFETQARLNPNWVPALMCRKQSDPSKPAVEGADQLLQRYHRVVTKGMEVPGA